MKKYNCYWVLLIVSVLIVVLAFAYKQPIDTVTLDELVKIQAIGEHKANLILQYIEDNPECSVKDLEEINGIGTTIVERLEKCYR